MAIYVYETVPSRAKERPRRFEIEQRMSDPPLTQHPQTGQPVRRVIVGGSGLVTHGASILSMRVPRARR
jgi:predicted nucleic acid-binding Zn ribbon protein